MTQTDAIDAANLFTFDIEKTYSFYADILGLDCQRSKDNVSVKIDDSLNLHFKPMGSKDTQLLGEVR